MELIFIVLVGLGVLYKLGALGAFVDMFDIATRESKAYNREHKVKVGKRYLNGDNSISTDDVATINTNIKAIDDLKFD